jgi:phage-related tail fiber protein
MADLPEQNEWAAGIYQLETSDPVLGGPDGIDNLQGKQLANRTRWLKDQIDKIVDGVTNVGKAVRLATARTLSITGAGTGSASFDGSANAAIELTLANSGATAGTYTKVTVNAKGLVTAGAALAAADIPTLSWSKITSGKPTTLAGYGVTDAYTKSQSDASAQSIVTQSKATQAQVNAGELDTVWVSPKTMKWGFSYSFTTNGYIVFPTWLLGIAFMWGHAQTNASGVGATTFPLAFPTACWHVVGTGRATTAALMGICGGNGAPTRTGYTWFASNHTGAPGILGIDWFAVGH